MSKIILILTFFVSSFFYGQQGSAHLNWETDFNVAKTKAKKSNKPILMLFTGSDWCPPCKLLKKDFFNSTQFKSKSKDFVLLLVDFPKNKDLISGTQVAQNKELNKAYGVRSLPTLIAVNHNGNVIDKIKSYNAQRDTSAHFEFIDKISK
jgi:thioredoxin-related protein